MLPRRRLLAPETVSSRNGAGALFCTPQSIDCHVGTEGSPARTQLRCKRLTLPHPALYAGITEGAELDQPLFAPCISDPLRHTATNAAALKTDHIANIFFIYIQVRRDNDPARQLNVSQEDPLVPALVLAPVVQIDSVPRDELADPVRPLEHGRSARREAQEQEPMPRMRPSTNPGQNKARDSKHGSNSLARSGSAVPSRRK